LWIISRDGDFGTTIGDVSFVNPVLQSEVSQAVTDSSLHLFTEIQSGLKHFIDTNKVRTEVELTADQSREIELEEKSLEELYSGGAMGKLVEQQKKFEELTSLGKVAKPKKKPKN